MSKLRFRDPTLEGNMVISEPGSPIYIGDFDFYRTRVRSLGMLVTNSLTH